MDEQDCMNALIFFQYDQGWKLRIILTGISIAIATAPHSNLADVPEPSMADFFSLKFHYMYLHAEGMELAHRLVIKQEPGDFNLERFASIL